MAGWIDSKRFAERWPFAGAVVLLAASALAISFLPATVSRDGKTFFLIVLYLLWIKTFRTRARSVGISTGGWPEIVLSLAIVFAGTYLFGRFEGSGPYLAAACFLGLQMPLIVMKSKLTPPEEPLERPGRTGQIFLGSLLFATVVALTAASWRSRQPSWVLPSAVFSACYFAWSVSKWIRYPQNLAAGPAPSEGSEAQMSGPETTIAKVRDPKGAAMANIFWICIVLAVLDLIFLDDYYGFLLPAAWFVLSVAWLSLVGVRHLRDSSKSAGTSSEPT